MCKTECFLFSLLRKVPYLGVIAIKEEFMCYGVDKYELQYLWARSRNCERIFCVRAWEGKLYRAHHARFNSTSLDGAE